MLGSLFINIQISTAALIRERRLLSYFSGTGPAQQDFDWGGLKR